MRVNERSGSSGRASIGYGSLNGWPQYSGRRSRLPDQKVFNLCSGTLEIANFLLPEQLDNTGNTRFQMAPIGAKGQVETFGRLLLGGHGLGQRLRGWLLVG